MVSAFVKHAVSRPVDHPAVLAWQSFQANPMNPQHIMSVDVEDWYSSSLDLFNDTHLQHGNKPDPSVVVNTQYSLRILRDTQNTATFFVLGTVAEHYPDLIRQILDEGHEVATHGYGHNLVYHLDEQSFAEDLDRSLEHLVRAGCRRIIGYRAPYWSITRKSLWALDVLPRFGIRYDSSIFPIRRELYGIPDAPTVPHKLENGLWEYPPATYQIGRLNLPVAGGGYLRLAPYSLLKRAILSSESGNTRVFYFHPYELDPADIRLKHKVRSLTTLLYWAQQAIGRKSNPEKLKRLMADFDFTTIQSVLDKATQAT